MSSNKGNWNRQLQPHTSMETIFAMCRTGNDAKGSSNQTDSHTKGCYACSSSLCQSSIDNDFTVSTSSATYLRSMSSVYLAVSMELRKIEYKPKHQDIKKSASESAGDGAYSSRDRCKTKGLCYGSATADPNNVTANSSVQTASFNNGDTSPIQGSQINGLGFATALQPANVNVSQPLPGFRLAYVQAKPPRHCERSHHRPAKLWIQFWHQFPRPSTLALWKRSQARRNGYQLRLTQERLTLLKTNHHRCL